jgi:hypothetical protein
MASWHSLDSRTWWSLGLAAFLIAYLTSARNVPRFVATFATSFLLLTFLFFGLVRLLRAWRESGKLHHQVEEQLAATRALLRREAQERALTLLLDAKLYRIVENPALADSLQSLGPELQKFFSRFEAVREIKGETSLDRKQIGASTLREGFLKIGTDMEHTEIVARPNEDPIYVIDGTEPEDEQVEEGFPTIYHYIVAGYCHLPDPGKKTDA